MLFRNDDISMDTDVNRFKEFCGVFDKYGLCQAHGVVINGYTNSNYEHGKLTNGAAIAVPYDGHRDIAEMNHAEIMKLSAGKFIGQNAELIRMLDERYWDEKVMHGLYHYTYDTDARILEDLPNIRIYFCAQGWRTNHVDQFVLPFNREPERSGLESRSDVCVKTYGAEGVHFESALSHVVINPSEIYRYHHHRFYPESVFDHYALDLEKLDACFARSFNTDAVKIPGLTIEKLRACLKKHDVQDWFTYNYEHCYTVVKEMLAFISNMHPRDKNTFLVYEFGAGVGLNLMRLRELGFKNMVCADTDEGALRVAEELVDKECVLTQVSDFTEFGADTIMGVKMNVAICLNAAMLDDRFSYEKFFDGLNNNMESESLLLIDSVDPEIEGRPEYKTFVQPQDLIKLAAKKLWYPIFFKRDGGTQVHRDFFIFKKL